ncbi:MAG: pilus assembly protein TadG-related protein [Asticcacaulis sp.]
MTSLSRFIRRFICQVRGNVTITVALAIVPMTAAIGGGVDFANVENARARLQDAADSAAIAAALDNSGNLTGQQAAADKSFNANISGIKNLTGASGSLSSATVNNVQTMSYSATAHVKTYMLGLVGMQTIDIAALAKSGVSINSAEIAFVLDNTGSMADNNKMTQLKSSLDATLASLLDSSGNNSGHTKVALVPFDTQVALNNVAQMTNYTGNYVSVSQSWTCTNLSTAQCTSVTSNNTYLINWIKNNYSTSASTTAAANIQTLQTVRRTAIITSIRPPISTTRATIPAAGATAATAISIPTSPTITTKATTAAASASAATTTRCRATTRPPAGNYAPNQVGYSGYGQYNRHDVLRLPDRRRLRQRLHQRLYGQQHDQQHRLAAGRGFGQLVGLRHRPDPALRHHVRRAGFDQRRHPVSGRQVRHELAAADHGPDHRHRQRQDVRPEDEARRQHQHHHRHPVGHGSAVALGPVHRRRPVHRQDGQQIHDRPDRRPQHPEPLDHHLGHHRRPHGPGLHGRQEPRHHGLHRAAGAGQLVDAAGLRLADRLLLQPVQLVPDQRRARQHHEIDQEGSPHQVKLPPKALKAFGKGANLDVLGRPNLYEASLRGV